MNSSAGITVLADGMAVVAEASVWRQEQCRDAAIGNHHRRAE